jgi:hypothetical protein
MSSQRRNPAAGDAARRASALDFPGGNVRTEVRIETTNFQSILIGQLQTNSREAARISIENDPGCNLTRVNSFSCDGGKLHPGKGGVCRNRPEQHPGVERIDFAAIAHEALPSLPAMLTRILPGGRIVRREYLARNPTRNDRSLGSFKIKIAGPRAGYWADFATSGKGRDVISLVAYVEKIGQSEAARLVARMLGIDLQGRRHG